tara:strand:- start:10079 stop:11089 length:1011 start_codon:yes stop_codon:yes gene_type:complete
MLGLMERFRFLLFPLALFYWGLTLWREFFYRVGFFVSHRLPVPVVSVGNITMGGSGKTPTVISIAETLLNMGKRPAIVSRGYGRATSGTVVVSDGEGKVVMWEESGDEPLLMATRLPSTPVVVDEERFRGGMAAVEQFGVDVLILDDAFQHRAVERDLDIVLINSREPKEHYRMFPYGRLREPTWSVGRSDIIILTKVDRQITVPSVQRKISQKAKTMLKSTLRPRGTERLKGLKVVAFCGIADPDSFAFTLTQIGADIVGLEKFRDHYVYNESDLSRLRKLLEKENADALVTTEKDWVKLPLSEKERNLIVPVPIDVMWLNEGEACLNEALQKLF